MTDFLQNIYKQLQVDHLKIILRCNWGDISWIPYLILIYYKLKCSGSKIRLLCLGLMSF